MDITPVPQFKFTLKIEDVEYNFTVSGATIEDAKLRLKGHLTAVLKELE